jgi:hypothetical protein
LRGAPTGKIQLEVLRDAKLKGVKAGDIVGIDASLGKVKP